MIEARIHDDSIGRLQVETETTGPSGEDEDLDVRVLGVELRDVPSTVLGLRATIKTEIPPALEILHDITTIIYSFSSPLLPNAILHNPYLAYAFLCLCLVASHDQSLLAN